MPERQMGIQLKDIEQKHKERYELAKQYCRDKVILDAACGNGYGSSMLSERAGFVFGVDRSAEAIACAKIHYQRDNIAFSIKDVDNDYLGCNYDMIVSLETIEHLVNPIKKTLTKFHSMLNKGGILVISHPENEESGNEYHKHMKIIGEEIIEFLNTMGFSLEHEALQKGTPLYDYHLYVVKKL
jgi:2-polyprenyl-3-methyl-5-hydroxy-6-metoxy-1,4-benzoquinol methylase